MSPTIVAIMAVAAVTLVIYSLWPKADEKAEAIKRRMSGNQANNPAASAKQKAKDSVARRMAKSVAPLAARGDAEGLSKLRVNLARAGFRGESAPTTLLASKSIVAVFLGISAVGYVWATGSSFSTGAGIIMIALGLGFLAPNIWLSSAIAKRATEVRLSLPDSLDMMVISVEAGLGLDAAFQRVGDEMSLVHPVIGEEFQLVTLETQMGIPRAEALTNFSKRCTLDEVKSLVAIVNQAEKFGTSIARALRNQADALRVKRRQLAEERAQKTTVKLMVPLVLFIFPAMLVVLAGPAALKMIDALKDTPGLL